MISIELFLLICVGLYVIIGLHIGYLELLKLIKTEIEEYRRRERAKQLEQMRNETEIRYLNNGNFDDLKILQKHNEIPTKKE